MRVGFVAAIAMAFLVAGSVQGMAQAYRTGSYRGNVVYSTPPPPPPAAKDLMKATTEQAKIAKRLTIPAPMRKRTLWRQGGDWK